MQFAHTPPVALTIAGSDPSGGAGLQADLKTFHQHGVYGMSVVTLITVQNTQSVSRVDVLDPTLVLQQLDAVLSDLPPGAIKTGALGNAAVISAVADGLALSRVPLVVDPVMISKHGHALISPDAVEVLIHRLLPLTTLLTPNTHEAGALLGRTIDTLEQAEAAGRELVRRGPRAVLVKGGHLSGAEATDVLVTREGAVLHVSSPRVESKHTHGTGCTYASAIAANLAKGQSLEGSVRAAKEWLSRAIAQPPDVGHGIGPVNHLASLTRP
jgi:hydroxymethylpyrimidine/phosphomethylpyrimidine kinase